ncbi:hypothetical protein DIS24_g4138 [Lasiodiplodia hormozganensis]|uniref:Uncharacterized protein n=1 Tax=Lasiodiplodia hormozganensis TaxID=869390 RepID=A0AA39YXH7_9PEZI|nr:hypothetical protein DIS24_g4138 [Lasiodiplodia hormozganensis]
MDLAFFDPDSTHADHLRAALEAHVAADARRAAKYGVATTASDDDVNHDDDCYLWPRGTTPDDVRAAYDDRLSAAMRELREATVESDEEEEDGDRVGVQPLPRAIAGKGWKGDLATPPSSGDEEERVAVGGKRKRGCEEDAMLGCENGAKRLRVDTDFTRLGRHLATPQFSPKRRSHAPRRISRSRKLTAGIQLYNTHAMTTRSKARKSRSSG